MPTVAETLIEGLRRAGVTRLFGVPGGGSNLELIEAARAQGLPFVLCHQESAACIMAAVTGELTGAPGAVLSTLGPGVAASATGLAHALLDRSPLIYLSDRHPAGARAFDTHQALNHAALVAPIARSHEVLFTSISRRTSPGSRQRLWPQRRRPRRLPSPPWRTSIGRRP